MRISYGDEFGFDFALGMTGSVQSRPHKLLGVLWQLINANDNEIAAPEFTEADFAEIEAFANSGALVSA